MCVCYEFHQAATSWLNTVTHLRIVSGVDRQIV